ncbi:MAG: cytochrome c5 family protein [Halioglobus sp.]|nr:cytochrome c5 family protein [Halioglobus sp.]
MSPLTLVTASLLALTLALAGCDGGSGSDAQLREVTSRTLQPEDTELAAIYNRSCRSCHTVAATRSPLTGDAAAWDMRMQKGMDVLVNNVINGIGGMPPFGLCMDCNADQFEALITFMATAPANP